MTPNILWSLIGLVLTVALAVLAIEEAGNNFQAVVFLVVLIGYHRLSWQISEDHQASRIRYLRAETWFHRLDSAIRGASPASSSAASLVAAVGDVRELEELKEIVEKLARSRQAELWVFRATELLLLVAIMSVVLR